MKKILLPILLVISHILIAQEHEIFYSIKTVNNINNSNTEVSAFKKQVSNRISQMKGILEIEKNKSQFYFEKGLNLEENNLLDMAVKFSLNSGDYFYFNSLNNESTIITESLGEPLTINGVQKFNWELSSETKVINNITCYKATLNHTNFKGIKKKVVVWYTKDIPLGLGPYGYHSLPGLAMELTINNITFSVTDINPKTKVSVNIPKKISYSIEQFKEIFAESEKKARAFKQ